MGDLIRQIREIPELLKIEHSLLALPFAFMASILAAGGIPSLRVCLLVAGAMFCARTAGMSFNRVLDKDVDAMNPRTKDRAVPAGRVSAASVWLMGILGCVGLSACAYLLNPLAFYLSFLCHVLLFSYSLMKRFTWGCHLFLGLVEAFAPLGGWIAVRGDLVEATPFYLALATIFWFAGLDIVYATQDEGFDKSNRLHSIPSRFGLSMSFTMARGCHVITTLLLLCAGISYSASYFYWLGMAAISALFIYQHSLVGPEKTAKLNLAFFGVNTWISFAMLITTLLETRAWRVVMSA